MQKPFKTFLLTIPLIVILSAAFNFVHEYGHVLGCIMYDYDYDVYYSAFGTSVSVCSGGSDNFTIHALGGAFGAIAALITTFVFIKIVWIKTVAIPLVISQMSMMILETLAHDWYIQADLSSNIVGLAFLVPYAIFVIKWIFNIHLVDLKEIEQR